MEIFKRNFCSNNHLVIPLHPPSKLQAWTKVLGHFCLSRAFSNSQRSNPAPLTPQTMLDACIQNFFGLSALYRVGRGRTARKFRKGCTVLRGNRQMTKKYEYCCTVSRTFVQDCSLSQNLLCTMVLSKQKEGVA